MRLKTFAAVGWKACFRVALTIGVHLAVHYVGARMISRGEWSQASRQYTSGSATSLRMPARFFQRITLEPKKEAYWMGTLIEPTDTSWLLGHWTNADGAAQKIYRTVYTISSPFAVLVDVEFDLDETDGPRRRLTRLCLGWPLACTTGVAREWRDGSRRKSELFRTTDNAFLLPSASYVKTGACLDNLFPCRISLWKLAVNTCIILMSIECVHVLFKGLRRRFQLAASRIPGRCECGYSRVGLPISSPCPECGACGRVPPPESDIA